MIIDQAQQRPVGLLIGVALIGTCFFLLAAYYEAQLAKRDEVLILGYKCEQAMRSHYKWTEEVCADFYRAKAKYESR
jgi:hypothetical protein